jgi:hypothetical protein
MISTEQRTTHQASERTEIEQPSLFSQHSQAATVQLGDIWRLGRHLLYCGDSANERFIKVCKQAQASFVFADPPYNAGVAEWYELHTRVYDEYRIETFPLTTDDETLRILRGWLAWLDILDKDRHAFASSVVYRTNWQDLYQAIALSRWDIDRIVQEAGRRNNGELLLEDKRSLVQDLILRYESQRNHQ